MLPGKEAEDHPFLPSEETEDQPFSLNEKKADEEAEELLLMPREESWRPA